MNPRPKFCVGEEVSVKCIYQIDMPRTEITDMYYAERLWMVDGPIYTGWRYRLADQENYHGSSGEENLRKLPPKADPWKDCAFNPLKIEA